jgi:type IX secretion system PorP/SprF family membrane protein
MFKKYKILNQILTLSTIRRAYLFLFFIFQFFISQSQDLHFSQFFNAPLSTNPANTGFIPDADYRLGGHFRNQYSSIMATPYKTFSVFGDAQIFRDKLETGWLGVGALLMNDVAGTGSLKSTKLYGSIAYHQMLGLSSLLSAGFNVGWASKSIELSKLSFPDQFDGTFFDNTLPTAVALNNTRVDYFDLQAGINYAYFPTEDMYYNIGYSIHHVNQPKETFFKNSGFESVIPIRHIAFANALIKLSNNVIIQPNIYYSNQAKSEELTLGMMLNYNLSLIGEKQLQVGAYYRNKESFIPIIGFQLSDYQITFSYDATTSSLNKFISLIKLVSKSNVRIFTLSKKSNIDCL